MNTPAHLIIGAAAFARADQRKVTTAALVGSLIPDLSLYVMVAWQMRVRGRSPDQVFGQDYRDPFWQTIFAIDNSILLYAGLLGLALWRRCTVLTAFAGAALIHVLLDFPLHHNDGRAHFMPLTDWVFESPVSYWDPNHYGWLVAPLEIALCLGLCVILWRRFVSPWSRAAIVAAMALEGAPALVFAIMFN